MGSSPAQVQTGESECVDRIALVFVLAVRREGK